jgi:hypothetical protein
MHATSLRRILVVLLTTLLACAAALAPATAAEAQAGTRITGRWVGAVKQEGFDPYRAKVRIFRTDAGVLRGRIVYATCSGVWKFRTRQNGWTKFTEVITEDPGEMNCVPRLAVKVKRVDAKLRIVWIYEGERATALARRV